MKHVPGWKAGESVYKTKVTWIPPRHVASLGWMVGEGDCVKGRWCLRFV